MSLANSEEIFLGFWINKSVNPIIGLTLTVKASHGALMVALSAILVQMMTAQLFGIICFIWHQVRAVDATTADKRWKQQQILLRNTASPSRVGIELIRLSRRNEDNTTKSLLGASLSLALTFTYLAGSLTAGIYSSTILNSANIEVLVKSPGCGFWEYSSELASESKILAADAALGTYLNKEINWSINYARSCYGRRDNNSSGCQIFASPSTEWISLTDRPCPFLPASCLHSDNALSIDTGLINTNVFLGINTALDDTLEFRKLTTCAPLSSVDRMRWVDFDYVLEHRPDLVNLPNDSYLILEYGEGPDGPWTWISAMSILNNIPTYTLSWQSAFAGHPENSTFSPDRAIERSDADVTLLIISANRMLFVNQSDDPIFGAVEPTTQEGWFDGQVLYKPALPVTAIGCTEQFSFCKPSTGSREFENCTPLTGIVQSTASIASLQLNRMQTAIFDLLFTAFYKQFNCIAAIANSQVPNLLAQQQTSAGNVQLPLAKNQWVLEMEDAHATVMAMLQRTVVDHATGPHNDAWQEFIIPPARGSAAAELCNLVRVRASGEFANISVFGLSIVILASMLIAIIEPLLPRIVPRFQSRLVGGRTRYQAWVDDGLYQMQEKAEQNGDRVMKSVDFGNRRQVTIPVEGLDSDTPAPTNENYEVQRKRNTAFF